jgi:hypothetical protein
MPGDSAYKDHIFNKETTHTFTNLNISTIQVYEQYMKFADEYRWNLKTLMSSVITQNFPPLPSFSFLSPLYLYSPIFGIGRLHKTFRFISVTRFRTVGRTPWTGDQLVARPLLTAPGDCEDGEVGGMNGFGMGNWSTQRKPAPTPICSPQIPLTRHGPEPGPPWWEASD